MSLKDGTVCEHLWVFRLAGNGGISHDELKLSKNVLTKVVYNGVNYFFQIQ